MIDKDDIELILKELNDVKRRENNEKINIETLKFENVKEKKLEVTYIDSSFVSGIVGPFVYVYARAFSISPNEIKVAKDFVLLSDTFITAITPEGKFTKLTIEDVGEILSKNLEYRLVNEAKTEFVVIDGSIYSDLILYDKGYLIIEEKIDKRYREFKENIIKGLKENIFSIAKRILHARFILESDKFSDFLFLLEKFPYKEFYTKILIKDTEKIKGFDKKIKAVYFRPRYGDHIYRLETVEDTKNENIIKLLYNEIYLKKRYPFGLKLAHNKAKITNKEKKIIEEYLRKIIGYDKTISWETK